VAATPGLDMACTIARTSRPGIAEVAARDLSQALIDGEFPEGSPFAPPEFECEEATESDTAPSPNGCESETPALEEGTQEEGVLEALGPNAAAAPKVDANVVSLAVALLSEAIAQSIPGKGLTAEEPPTGVSAGRQSAPSVNGGNRGTGVGTRPRQPPGG